ncbi:MAG: hypothetical protein J6V24_08785 [Clostridia bacterium]|nr:hypothetical protein [Clostridia bacterium]
MAEDIGSMVEKIIGNPEFQTLVGELRGSGEQPEADALMSSLPEVVARISPLFSSSAPDPGKPPVDEPVVSGGKFNRKNAERLLAALKPYLRASRCGIIDKCMSVMQISDLIGAAGGLGALTGPPSDGSGGGNA